VVHGHGTILSKNLTVRSFINNEFGERAPEAFIGMLEGRNFGELIVRVYV
jgi:NADPH-dependent curcumin reductase CurA